MVEIDMSCGGREPHRHAHFRGEMRRAASSAAPTRGQSPQPAKKPKPKPRGAYIPRPPGDDD